jgi:hypothetical protein
MNLLETIKYGLSNSYILNTTDLSIALKDAIDFTKYINCITSNEGFCDICSICSRINKGEHPDLIIIPNNDEFKLNDSIKIDDIRLLKQEAILNPVNSKYRVLVINYADRMTEQAQNSILKILEESPKKTITILITDNIFGLLSTIKSRCRQVNYSFKKNINIDFLKNLKILQDTSINLESFFCKCKEVNCEKDGSGLLDFIDFCIIFLRDTLSNSFNGSLISNGINNVIGNIKIKNIPDKIDKLNHYRFLVKNKSINKDLIITVIMSILMDY